MTKVDDFIKAAREEPFFTQWWNDGEEEEVLIYIENNDLYITTTKLNDGLYETGKRDHTLRTPLEKVRNFFNNNLFDYDVDEQDLVFEIKGLLCLFVEKQHKIHNVR